MLSYDIVPTRDLMRLYHVPASRSSQIVVQQRSVSHGDST